MNGVVNGVLTEGSIRLCLTVVSDVAIDLDRAVVEAETGAPLRNFSLACLSGWGWEQIGTEGRRWGGGGGDLIEFLKRTFLITSFAS